ncbi:MAG: hypothetical protein SFW08_08760 [Gemmatimonadaceae bacterium]|nr:hypothetical protein [Gemmatimonadaceae bacterium]
MRRPALVAAWVFATLLAAPAAAQTDELSRLVQRYRAGDAEAAVQGLQALLRTTASVDQRPLIEQHIGFALLRLRPPEATPYLRRSIAAAPELAVDPGASVAERAAWTAQRELLPIPSELRFDVADLVVGNTDSLVSTLTVPAARGRASFRVRVRTAIPGSRDSVQLWSGRSGAPMTWDGQIGGALVAEGPLPVVVDVIDDLGGITVNWRRTLAVRYEPVTTPLALPARPQQAQTFARVTVDNLDAAARARRNGIRWMLGGSLLALTSAALVQPAVDLTAAGAAPRYVVATSYLTGLGLAAIGTVRFLSVKTADTVLTMPDEVAVRRNRAALARWQTDSARVARINAALSTARRVRVQVLEETRR